MSDKSSTTKNTKTTPATGASADKQPQSGGGWLGGITSGVTNTASGLASTGGSVIGGTLNTAGGAVGSVGRGLGKTLSDASTGLEGTVKGGADTVHGATGADKNVKK